MDELQKAMYDLFPGEYHGHVDYIINEHVAQLVAKARNEALDEAVEIADAELGDWGDGGEVLRSGQRLTVFLMERSDAIMHNLKALKVQA